MNPIIFVLPRFEPYSPRDGLALAIIVHEMTHALAATGVSTVIVTPPSEHLFENPVSEVVVVEGTSGRWRSVRRRIGFAASDDRRYADRVVRAIESAGGGRSAIVVLNDVPLAGRLASSPGLERIAVWLENDCPLLDDETAARVAGLEAVYAVSSYIAGTCAGRLPVSVPVSVLPNGVNAEHFSPLADTALHDDATVRACFVGRIDPNKGPLLAAEAVIRARARGHAITLDVAGPVQAWGSTRADAELYSAALESALTECGGVNVGRLSREELPAFYRDHQIAFVPSVANEPFGLVALEAMGCGCAVISSDRGGLPEVCGGAALLVDPESPEQFDRAIDELLTDRQRLRAARDEARQRAESATWSVSARILLDALS